VGCRLGRNTSLQIMNVYSRQCVFKICAPGPSRLARTDRQNLIHYCSHTVHVWKGACTLRIWIHFPHPSSKSYPNREFPPQSPPLVPPPRITNANLVQALGNLHTFLHKFWLHLSTSLTLLLSLLYYSVKLVILLHVKYRVFAFKFINARNC